MVTAWNHPLKLLVICSSEGYQLSVLINLLSTLLRARNITNIVNMIGASGRVQ